MDGSGGRGAPRPHVCHAYDDPADLDAAGLAYLGEAAAAGARTWWVSATAPADTGPAAYVPLLATYATDDVVDPADQVRAYAAATEAALADGFTGLRVVADVTPLVRTAEQFDAFARYEHLVDRYMAGAPFAAMCAYDRAALGEPRVAEMACLHPRSNDAVGFRLVGCPPAEGAAVLTGELDASTEELLGVALRRADPRPHDGELVLSADGLDFVDHRSLTLLERHAAAHEATLVLRTGLPTVARLAGLLDLTVRVEPGR